MKDTIIKGTRNSRSILGAQDIPESWPEALAMLKSTGWPIDLGPLNLLGCLQIGTGYTKPEVLSDETAELYTDLPPNPVVDDVLAWIGKYNTHWWRRRVNVDNGGYVPKEITPEDVTILGQLGTLYLGHSSNVSVDPKTGEISLVSPVNLQFTLAAYLTPTLQTLGGKYVSITNNRIKNRIFLLPNPVNYTSSGGYVTLKSGTKEITSEFETDPFIGDWIYIQSENRNAYPDGGIVDGYEYEYLGIPFKNSVEAAKITYGLYTGTGKNGPSYPNTLTFAFVPKILCIFTNEGTPEVVNNGQLDKPQFGLTDSLTTAFKTGVLFSVTPASGSYASEMAAKKSPDGKTITWYARYYNKNTGEEYGANGISYQMNVSGRIYRYVAIG